MSEYTVSVRLKADGSGLVGEVKLSAEALKDLAAQTAQSGSEAAKAKGEMMSWTDFVKSRMGPAMREFHEQGKTHAEAHTLAIRKIAEEWKSYKASADGAVAATNKVTEAQEAATAATQRGTSAWIDYLKGLAGYDIVKSAAFAIRDYVKETMMLAARHEELGVVMAVVGRNAGYTRTQMAGYAGEVRAMGITMIESRDTVVQLAQAEIDLSHASQLARAAQDTAVIGMTNSSDALQRMIYGIKSGQVEVLRTLGINVSFEQSYKRLAAELHTTTEALSEKQKMQARENAVLEEAAKVTGVYEEAMGTAGKQMRSMARYTEDLKVMRGEVFNEALTVAVMAFVEQLKESNKAVTELSQSGKLKDWGSSVATTLAYAADTAVSFIGVIRLAGTYMAEFAAKASLGLFVFPGQIQAIEQAAESQRAGIISSMAMFRDALEKRRATQQADVDKRVAIDKDYVTRALAVQKGGVDASIEIQQQAQLMLAKMMYPQEFPEKRPDAPGAGRKAREEVNDYDRLIKSIKEKIAVSQLDLQTEEKLTEGQKLAAKVMADIMDGQLKGKGLTAEQIAAKKVLIAAGLEELIGNEKLLTQQERDKKAREETLAIIAKLNKAARDQVDAVEREAASIEDEVRTYGLSKDAVLELSIAKLEDSKVYYSQFEGSERMLAALNREIEARRALIGVIRSHDAIAAAKKAADEQIAEQKRANEEINRGLTDALMRGFERGEGFAKNFWQSMINMAKTTVLRPVISFIVSPISGAITAALGGLGIPGMANAASGAGMLGNGASSLFGAGVTGSSAAYGLAVPGLTMGGTQASMLAAQTGAFGAEGLSMTAAAGGATWGSMAMAAVPYVGLALAAAYALGLFDSNGPKNPNLGISTSGVGAAPGLLGVSQNDFGAGSMTAAGAGDINAWLQQLPDTLKTAIDGMIVELAPGSTAEQAWAQLHARIIETAKSLNLTQEQMRHLGTTSEQAAVALQIANTKREMDIQIMEASGNATGALAARREDELAALGDLLDANGVLLADTKKQLYAAQDKAAQDAKDLEAAKRIADERKGLQNQLDDLTMTDVQLLAKQRAGLDESNQALFDAVQARKAELAAINATNAAITTQADLLRSAMTPAQQHALDIAEMTAAAAAAGIVLPRTALEFEALVRTFDPATQWGRDAIAGAAKWRDTLFSTFDNIAEVPAWDAFGHALNAAAEAQLQGVQQVLDQATQAASQAVADARKNVWSAYDTEAQKLKGLAEQMRGFSESLHKLQSSLLLGSESPLSPMEKFFEAQRQFRDISTKAKLGDADALDALSGASQSYLQAGRGAFASGDAYNSIFAEVQAALGASADTADRAAANALSQIDLLQTQVEQLVGIREDMHSVALTLDEAMKAFVASRGGTTTIPGGWPGPTYAQGTDYVPRTGLALVHQGESITPAGGNAALLGEIKALRAEVQRLGAIVEAGDRANVAATDRVAESRAAIARGESLERRALRKVGG